MSSVVNPRYNFLNQPIFPTIESYAATQEQSDTSMNGTYSSGTFTVGSSGNVGVDYVFDGAAYHGELAIFSLQGMGNLTPGSTAFIQEAARRALEQHGPRPCRHLLADSDGQE